ncbi:MAG: tetratricopeptide repeat protein [Proteobacteria bacterium]|nr:tetratricopeptide repeat protein [Pseudomonadota bacterium]MCL2307788.1 tetratricopeptide repeat protein [Pseudomonadota bacterium]
MKRRILSLSLSVFAAVWLVFPTAAFGQSPNAVPAPEAEVAPPSALPSALPSIPAELSAEARARYEAQMKTLRAQIDAQKWQEALATAEAMNKERPREPQARFLKTLVLTELGRDEEAKRELLALVSDYPELPEPRNNLATLYAKKGEYDLARRELELALTAVPDYGIAHANLADLYLQQAMEHYRRAAALAKNSKDSKAFLARADAVQTLLAPTAQAGKTPTPPQDAEAAKDEKNAAKENDFLLGGCDAPPGFGGKDDDDDVFSGGGGTCDIEFDEPAPEKGGDGKEEKAPTPAPAPTKTP